MLLQLLAESAGHFWWPAESENLENPDFKNLKHLQKSGTFFADCTLYDTPCRTHTSSSKMKNSLAEHLTATPV